MILKTQLTREDGVWLLYKGEKHYLKSNDSYRRGGTDSPSLNVYVLENNKRILPVHFSYSLASIPGNFMVWLLRASYPKSVMREALLALPLLSKIPKDDSWLGGYMVVPFAVGGQK